MIDILQYIQIVILLLFLLFLIKKKKNTALVNVRDFFQKQKQNPTDPQMSHQQCIKLQ